MHPTIRKQCAIVTAAVLTLTILLVARARAADDGTPPPVERATAPDEPLVRPLTDDRWEDHAYGMSFRLPAMARTSRAEGSLVEIIDEQKLYTLTVKNKRPPKLLTLDAAILSGIDEMAHQQNTNQLVEAAHKVALSDRQAGVLKFHSPQALGGPVFVAFGIVPIDMASFVVLEIRCDYDNREKVEPIFDAVLASVEFGDLKELQEVRRKQLDMTRSWRQAMADGGINATIEAALIPEQWYRIIEKNKDVGYVNIVQKHGERELRKGTIVTVRSRVAVKGKYVDSLDQYFLSDDDEMEAWSQRATERPEIAVLAPRGKAAPQNPTIVKTGIRTGPHLTITIDDPTGKHATEYVRPDVGYLSQVESWLLPQILPINRPGTYGFYYYNPEERKITFRTDKVIPALTGYTVITRLTPNAPEIHANFDRQRQLIEKRAGATRVISATREQIEGLWRGR
ncbi:MAG: hypothetical protein GC159_00340 [Phycisphaera sp.]|nr:hypothetical protein [Phycisphaera sp.]